MCVGGGGLCVWEGQGEWVCGWRGGEWVCGGRMNVCLSGEVCVWGTGEGEFVWVGGCVCVCVWVGRGMCVGVCVCVCVYVWVCVCLCCGGGLSQCEVDQISRVLTLWVGGS